MRLLAAVWIALLMLAPGCTRESAPPSDVDVVVYLVDTLRRDRLGVYGHPKRLSPNLDALALESFVFDNAYAPAPWTLPSVASLLTSSYPVDHGIHRPGQTIPRDFPTLPRRLQELGYRTAGFSANPLIGPASAVDAQFEHFERLPRELRTKPIEHWLDEIGEDRFFLYVQTTEPHEPYVPPAEYLEAAGSVPPGTAEQIAKLTVSWRRGQSLRLTDLVARLAPRVADLEVLYDGTVAWADARLGKLVDVLRRRGRWDRTLFVFVSDHGEELFDHGGLFHGQSLYPELIRIPMIWRIPGRSREARHIAAPANLVDLMPTLLAYLGRPDLAAGCQGRNLFEAVGETPPAPPSEARVTSVRRARPRYSALGSRGRNNIALVEGPWTGIWNEDPDTVELYDARTDPGQHSDVASDHPGVAGSLRRAAERWLAERPEIPGLSEVRESTTVDPQTHERLRSLGYVE